MTVNENKNDTKRNYDQNPIVIRDYGVLFESYLIVLIGLIGIPLLMNDIYKVVFENENFTFNILLTLIVWIYFFYLIFIDYPKKFKEHPSFFIFKENYIEYILKYLQKKEDNLHLIVPIVQIDHVSFCIMSELPDRYGRLHYLTPWKLYRNSSIGVHIGKVVLFLRYMTTYVLFILPYKLWRLYKSGEPLSLLRKNLFIQLKNRNYLLINIYSVRDFNNLIEYFNSHNIPIDQKTHFIPHLQNQGWFVDKEEVWSNEFDNSKGGK